MLLSGAIPFFARANAITGWDAQVHYWSWLKGVGGRRKRNDGNRGKVKCVVGGVVQIPQIQIAWFMADVDKNQLLS